MAAIWQYIGNNTSLKQSTHAYANAPNSAVVNYTKILKFQKFARVKGRAPYKITAEGISIRLRWRTLDFFASGGDDTLVQGLIDIAKQGYGLYRFLYYGGFVGR